MISLLRPLGLSLLAFVAGLLPALRSAPPPAPLLLAAIAASATLVVLSRRTVARGPRVDVLILLAFAAAGACSGAVAAAEARSDCRALLADGAALEVAGILGAAPVPTRSRAPPPLLPLEQATLRDPGTGASCQAAVRIRLPPSLEARGGSTLRASGRWIRLAGDVSPSAWPSEGYYRGYIAADTNLALEPPSWHHPLLWLRGRTEASLRRLFGDQGALAEALLLGRREWVDADVRDVFARSGLVHLLAISGGHVVLIAAMLLVAGTALRLRKGVLAAACGGAVALYLAMIGAPPSAVRAGIMLGLALLGTALQRPSAHLAVIAAAALLILAFQPLAALDPGLQLSFAGVLGILAARPITERTMPLRWRRGRLGRFLVEPLVVSAAAFVATAPITAHHFGQVAPISIAGDLPAIPLTSLALVGVVTAATADPVAPPLARLLADGGGVALAALARVAEVTAAVPGGHFGVTRPPWWSWGFALAAALAASRLAIRLRPAVRALVAGGAALAVLLVAPAAPARDGGALEVYFLDVGQGDAIALRTPAGRWILIDAGPRGNDFDAGERRVLPFLRAHGARRLEAVVLTHPDLDHIGGAPAVLRGIEVGRLIEPGLPVGKEIYRELLAAAAERGIPWSAARAGRSFSADGVHLRFLWPDSTLLDSAPDANQISGVARVEFEGFSLLLMGDAPADVERELVARDAGLLRADVLKVGHHGSTTSTSMELLGAARPELAVISAGRRNRYGHPAPSVLRRLDAQGIGIARTDRDGTISLRIAAGGGGQWIRVQP